MLPPIGGGILGGVPPGGQVGGVQVGFEQNLNFIAGTGMTITGVDNPANNRLDITFNSTGGGGTPGGTSGQFQYNNGAGAFAGAAGLVWAASGTNVSITAQNNTDVALSIVGHGVGQSGNLV